MTSENHPYRWLRRANPTKDDVGFCRKDEFSSLRIRRDEFRLVDKVFSVQNPILALNRLVTESERSEQTGYATLLKGCFVAIRNPLAHTPRLFWDGEDDAADILSLLSLLHRKLDGCVPALVSNPQVSGT